MDLQLTDQTVFVAGSSRGIGRAIAAMLLAEGANVVLTGRDPDSLEQTRANLTTAENRSRILAIAGNFTDSTVVKAGLDQIVSQFGKLSHLIANYGTGSGTPGPTPPAEDWIRLFEQNFFASVRLTEACLPLLRANPSGGSILYISSIVAVEATPAPLPYSASKAALNSYAKNLSRQLASEHIRVNTIAPGNIFFSGGVWERHLTNRREAVEEMLKNEVPQRRFGTPEEIASLAAYLCSPHSAFCTGGVYIMDGGQTRVI